MYVMLPTCISLCMRLFCWGGFHSSIRFVFKLKDRSSAIKHQIVAVLILVRRSQRGCISQAMDVPRAVVASSGSGSASSSASPWQLRPSDFEPVNINCVVRPKTCNMCAMCEIRPGTINANLPDTLENREKVLRTQLPDWPIITSSVLTQLTISALLCAACKMTETQALAQSLQAEEANLQEAMLQSAQEYMYIEAIAVSLADCTTRGEDEDEDIREAMRLSMADDSERQRTPRDHR